MQTMLRKSKSRVEALRCRIMLLLHERAPVVEVAQMVGCVRATVYRTVYRFEALDEASLVDRRTTRGTEKVTTQMEEQLLSYLDAVPPDYGWQRSSWSLELLSRQLEDGCGVTLSCSTIYRVLVSQGCRRGRPRPGVLTPGKNLKRYIFGALNARTGPIVSGVVEHKNAAMFVEFLKYLSTTYRRARRLHLVLDNYIIHKAGVVKRYLESTNRRFVLHLLPPYSPNHNVIERLWKQMHDHVTRNHRHRHIDTLVAAARCFLHTAQPFPGTKVSTLRAA
jgi:transposase